MVARAREIDRPPPPRLHVGTLPAKYVQIDGDAVHYLHTGPTTLPDVAPALDRGSLFVFVHGAGRNAGDFRRAAGGLGGAHSVVALDLPAHGRSTGLDARASVDAYADVIERFVSAVVRRPIVLVGWSMGASAALVVASRGTVPLAGLVLMAGAAVWPLDDALVEPVRDVVRGRRPQIFDRILFCPDTPLDLVREAWMEQAKTDPRVLWSDLVACRAFDGRALLGRVRVPTLVVHGADDPLAPRARADELAAGIPGARLAVIDGAGHFPHLEQSAGVVELLAGFAAGLA